MLRIPILRILYVLGLVTAAPAQSHLGIWHEHDPPTAPRPRMDHQMIYDPVRDIVLLHSGKEDTTGSFSSWTYGFDGNTWTLLSTGTVPRGPFGFAWDPTRDHAVLAVFAGPGLGYSTWLWDGAAWTQHQATLNSSIQGTVRMVYDQSRDRMVLVSSENSTGGTNTQTWEFDGIAWLLRTTGGPPNRRGFSLAHDSSRGRTVLFGGDPNTGPLLDDLWEWDGNSWIQYFPTGPRPSGRRTAAMAYDQGHHAIVLHGGWSGAWVLGDSWEWDGVQWRFINHRGVIPPKRFFSAMAHDPDNDRLVGYGGHDGPSSPPTAFDDTWFLSIRDGLTATWTTFGQGCPGSAGTPALDVLTGDRAYIGETFSLVLTGLPASPMNVPFGIIGYSKTSWAGLALPLALDPYGMPGCVAYVEGWQTVQLSNWAGNAVWHTEVPLLPALIGNPFYLQGLVLDPDVNTFGAVVSNAGEGTIGVR